MRVTLILACVAGLGACSTPSPELVSTLPERAAAGSGTFVGESVPPLAATDAAGVLARVRATVVARLAGDARQLDGEVMAGDAPLVRIRLPAARSFEDDAAQLRVDALAGHAALADVLAAEKSLVVHVRVHGDARAGTGFSGLPARRAATLQSYLGRRGVAGSRIRADGRASDSRNGTDWIEMILVPVVQGREAAAWQPPS